MKVGFDLLPIALEGLGLISHLINIDTVEDLVNLMKGVLQGTNVTHVPLVQLYCIHCSLKTLSGPGQELKIDDDVFITALRVLIRELPSNFERWDIVLECLDFGILKRRENKIQIVNSFVNLLILHSSHVLSDAVATSLLAMTNMILLKYPRVRSENFAIAMASFTAAANVTNSNNATTTTTSSSNVPSSVLVSHNSRLKIFQNQDEDVIEDLAMKALQGNQKNDDVDSDGSWLLSLLKTHIDRRFSHIILALTAKDVTTIPLRIIEAKLDTCKVLSRIETVFQTIPSMMATSSNHHQTNTASVTIKQMSKNQIKNMKRKSISLNRLSSETKGGKSKTLTTQDENYLLLSTINQRIKRARIDI